MSPRLRRASVSLFECDGMSQADWLQSTSKRIKALHGAEEKIMDNMSDVS